MTETAVVNASPLIFLGRAKRLDLLYRVAGPCIVPEPVLEEILRRGQEDATVRAMAMHSWLTPMLSPSIPNTIAAWGLGPGESSVLALVLANPTTCPVAVIDDLAARHCAASLGIPVRGTLGIVLVAKKKGVIPLARPVLEELIAHGMYLSRRILDEALSRVGE